MKSGVNMEEFQTSFPFTPFNTGIFPVSVLGQGVLCFSALRVAQGSRQSDQLSAFPEVPRVREKSVYIACSSHEPTSPATKDACLAVPCVFMLPSSVQ